MIDEEAPFEIPSEFVGEKSNSESSGDGTKSPDENPERSFAI